MIYSSNYNTDGDDNNKYKMIIIGKITAATC